MAIDAAGAELRVLGPNPNTTEGDPVELCLVLHSDEAMETGIWESTPGKWRIEYDEWEFCHILSGVSVISEDSGEARTVRAGDSFVLRPGFKGSGEVLETTRKEYVIRV